MPCSGKRGLNGSQRSNTPKKTSIDNRSIKSISSNNQLTHDTEKPFNKQEI